jgi:ADP-ribosyl-[dinitrogen reductase] hydrolase
MVNTSKNNPLRISELPLGKGVIGMSICPGKHDPDAWSGPCARSLAADLLVIRSWGTGVVVTLMEAWELDLLHVSDLGTAVTANGMSWWHLPVKDGFPLEYPGDGFLEARIDRWRLPCSLLLRFLHAGGRAFIHCRGGLGRTGSLAARLLMEDGLDAASAIGRVRDCRPGTVETEEQEDYLLRLSEQLRKAWSRPPLSVFEAALSELCRQPALFRLEGWERTTREIVDE